jgi:hypothetical protein
MIKKFESFSQELKDYVNGKTKLTPQMNILINDRSKDWYAEVGKYFVDLFDGDLPGGLSFYNDKIDKLGVFDKLSGKSERLYSNIGIFIFTSIFDEEVLKKIFGDPLYHDEFGEGFEGEYDEETEEYSEPENKFQYASYFIEIDGVKFHIGYDHRGTSMEVEIGTSPQKVFDCIKSLIDKYKINLNF